MTDYYFNKLGPGEVLLDPLHSRRKLVVARGAEDNPEEARRWHAHSAARSHSHADLVHQPPRERCLCAPTATPPLQHATTQTDAKIYRCVCTPTIGGQPRSQIKPGEEAGLAQLNLWLAPAVSNEGRSSPLLVLVPAVSWPWVPACASARR